MIAILTIVETAVLDIMLFLAGYKHNNIGRYCYFCASAIFLSVLYWLNAYTAQIAAGIQPIRVS